MEVVDAEAAMGHREEGVASGSSSSELSLLPEEKRELEAAVASEAARCLAWSCDKDEEEEEEKD